MMDKDLANFIYENTTRSTLDLDLQGIWMNDRELLLRFYLEVRLTLGLNTALTGQPIKAVFKPSEILP